jgi:hypothetical protein
MKSILCVFLALQLFARSIAGDFERVDVLHNSLLGDEHDDPERMLGYSSSPYGTNIFADSEYTYYDGYQQAWRMLGFYVDCSGQSSCTRYLLWAMVSGKGQVSLTAIVE